MPLRLVQSILVAERYRVSGVLVSVGGWGCTWWVSRFTVREAVEVQSLLTKGGSWERRQACTGSWERGKVYGSWERRNHNPLEPTPCHHLAERSEHTHTHTHTHT